MDPESKVDGWEMGYMDWVGLKYSTKVQPDEQQASCLMGRVEDPRDEMGYWIMHNF